MNGLKNNRLLLGAYLFFLVWAIVNLILFKIMVLTPLLFFSVFLFFLFTPGFSLSRIFKIEFAKDCLGQLVLWLALGFIFIFLENFTAMFLGLTINVLSMVFLISIACLYVLALLFDLFRKHAEHANHQPSFELREFFTWQNILMFLLVPLSLFALYLVGLEGSLFRGGDPNFHLSILRKAFGDQPLTPENLNYVKSPSIHIAYGFPIWHIFLSMLAKILKTNIFVVWEQVALPLSALVFLVWYWLFRKIYPTKNLSVLGLLLFITFYFGAAGFLFTCLPIPDTFVRLLPFPICLALAIKYIFDQSVSWKVLIVFSLLLILVAAIHFSHYFYFILIMFLLIFGWLIFKNKEPDFKPILKRIILATFANFVFLAPLIFFLEIHGRAFSSTLKSLMAVDSSKELRYGRFQKFGIYFQYAYLMLPLLLIFLRKYRKLLIVLAIMLVTPLTYLSFVKTYLLQYLGYIFVNRIFGTLTWHFAVWAFVLGFVLVLVDRLISRIGQISKFLRYLFDFILGILAAILAWAQIKSALALKISNLIFSEKIHLWFNNNYLWILLILLIIALTIYFWQRKSPKLEEFFSFIEPKNHLSNFFMVFMIIFILFAPNFLKISEALKIRPDKNYLLKQADALEINEDLPSNIGGKATLNFIREQIPPKSVFISNGRDVYLAMLTDQHMASYPHSAYETIYKGIFQNNLSSKEKMELVKQAKVNYILLVNSSGKAFFDENPKIFSKIYHRDKISIYRVLFNQ